MPLKVMWRGAEVSRRVSAEGRLGLQEFAEHILEEARRQVPHDEGTLERDSETFLSEHEGRQVAVVSFGLGPASAYAMRQHEELEWRHQPGRKAKYLEDPVKEHEGEMAATVGGRVKRAFR